MILPKYLSSIDIYLLQFDKEYITISTLHLISNFMKTGSTWFLRIVLIIGTLITLAFCIFAIPPITEGAALEFPPIAPLREAIVFGLYLIAIPFFFSIYQSFKLLNYIDKNIAFSELSVKALRKIKYAATVMSGLCMLGMPVVFLVAQWDDAPGLVIVGFLAACSPLVVSVFAAVLQKLVDSAIEIKSENDLTV